MWTTSKNRRRASQEMLVTGKICVLQQRWNCRGEVGGSRRLEEKGCACPSVAAEEVRYHTVGSAKESFMQRRALER